MNRARKVDDLYESLKSIADRDAFQHILDLEPEDYVLADLKERFWDGTGKQPWQVTEINRLLTRRKELRAASRPKPTEFEKSKTLRAKIEDNPVVFFLTTVVTAFGAGLATYSGILKLTDHIVVPSELVQKLKEDVDNKNLGLERLRENVKQLEARSTAEPITHLVQSESGEHAAAQVSFVNASARELEILWIDTSGNEQPLERLGIGKSYSVSTFAAHLLLVKDSSSGEQLLLLSPRGRQPAPVTVELRASQ